MNKLELFIDKIKVYAKTFYNKINGMLNTAFPDVLAKRFVIVAFACVELMIFYAIALLDIGIWVGDCTPFGIIAAYWTNGRFYPFFTFLLLGGGLAVLFYVYINNVINGNTGRGFTIAESNVYGSARDINRDELEQVAEIKPKEAAMGMILGQLDETETQLVTTKNIANFNKNFLCLAPPGSGKTATIVLNAIIQAIRRGESVITTDTKGEIWAKTVELARLHGYTIRRFDLKKPLYSDGWDILGEIQMDVDRAGIIANIIMANTSSPNEKDIHAGAEESLLTALCLYQCLHPSIPDEEKTLYNAYGMLFQGAEGLDTLFNSIQDDPLLRPAFEFYTGALQGSTNLRSNVVAGLAKRLSPLSNPPIRDLTSTPDIDLTLPGNKKCIYYVEMNDQINNKRFLSSLFFSFVFLDLCELADNRDDLVLPVPVNVMIEEMYACGYLPTVTNALSTVRSRGISLTMIAQGIDQFKILYGDEMTNVILECCAIQACLGSNSPSTSELFEWLSGEATVDVKTEQHEILESPVPIGRRYSTGYGRQSLYTSNDIRKIKFGQILIVFQRFDPLMAHTFFYKRHPEFMKGNMPEVSGRTNVPLMDKEARAYLRAREEQRVLDYEAWLAAGGNPWKGYLEPAHEGPVLDADIPEITPYPELEAEALAHSEQARGVRKSNLMDQINQTQPVPAPANHPQDIFPDNYSDDDNDEDDAEYDTIDLERVFPHRKDSAESEGADQAQAQTPAEPVQDSPATNTTASDNSTQSAPSANSSDPQPQSNSTSSTAQPAEQSSQSGAAPQNAGSTPKKEEKPKSTKKSVTNKPPAENSPETAPEKKKPTSKKNKGRQSAIVLDDTPGRKSANSDVDQVGEIDAGDFNYDDLENKRRDNFLSISKTLPK